MKKLLLITIVYWALVGIYILLNQDNDLNTSPLSRIIKMVGKYDPLQPENIDATDFFAHISEFEDADRCGQMKMNRGWSLYYPSKGLVNRILDPDSILPPFELKYEDFDSSLVKEILKPIIDNLYLNEFYLHEFRFESHYPAGNNLTKETYYQQFNLRVFQPENPKLHGLVTEPVKALDGACIELIYNLSDKFEGNIFLDESKPLVYEIKSTADTVSHIFSFYLKGHQFFDIRSGLVDLSIIPPPRYDYTSITKDMVGDLVYLDTIPLLVSAFENGMLHLIYDSRIVELHLEDFYFSEKGEYLDSKIEGTVLDFSSYHIYRNNAQMDAQELCSKSYRGDNMNKFMKDIYRIEGSVYYKTMIISMGCDPDEVHIIKKRRHFYDDILGSRIMLFSLDTVGNEYYCTLVKKDEHGALKTLYEDTTRTEPKYEGLVKELVKYLAPVSTGMRDEVIVRVQAMVHKDGTMTDVKLYTDSGDTLLDENAINAVKSLKNKWEPATLHGDPIDMGVIIPIRYKKR
ncbi:MAG: energy transducer TonB [Tannerella sp.]|jgi:TonB family protein|nr:energy transducer TonB [Tannerella sp.]